MNDEIFLKSRKKNSKIRVLYNIGAKMTTSGTTGGLPGIDGFRGEDCLDPATLGLFAEGKLRPQERQTASSHLLACPYCVKQLNDMMEMLYYERLPMKLPLRFYGRLKRLCPEERKKKPKRRRGLQLRRQPEGPCCNPVRAMEVRGRRPDRLMRSYNLPLCLP